MKTVLLAAMAMMLALAGSAFASALAEIPWNQANLETLRSFDKAAVEEFVNRLRGDEPLRAKIGDFGWYDLAGDGHYSLVVTADRSGRNFFDDLMIYSQNSAGKVYLRQWIEAWGIGTNLNLVLRDLDGNGRYELIIPSLLVSHSAGETFTWPAVYRLEKGKYVEASADFPRFYDDYVLPELDKQISIGRSWAAAGKTNVKGLAEAEMEKDKILRVLGRDPTAGLERAREWMRSDNPDLIQDAAVTFSDIGGHEAEQRAATAAWRRALCERAPEMGICGNLPGSGASAVP